MIPPNSALHGFSARSKFLNGQIRSTLIPEPFTLNRETGAKGEVSKNRETGYRVQDEAVGETEAVVVVLQEGCFFSELRVITFNN